MLRAPEVSPNKAKKETSSLIRVEFREAHTKELILVRHIDAQELPSDFHTQTEIDLGIGVWRVHQAFPPTKQEFSSSAELTLWIARAEEPPEKTTESADEVLFAPSSQHSLPELSELPSNAHDLDLLYLYQEDWLTNQLIPSIYQHHIRKEFSAIARTPMGMTHNLPSLPTSSLKNLSVDLIADTLDAGFFDGVVLCRHSRENFVSNGFAMESERGTIIYGYTDPEHPQTPTTIGIHTWEDESALLADLQSLANLSEINADDLLFVSWNSQSMLSLKEALKASSTPSK